MRNKPGLVCTPGMRRPLLFCLLFLFTSGFLAAQTRTGTVSGTNGQITPGVTVQVKGTSKATATNNEGRFTIDAPDNATLVFTGVGLLQQEVAVAGKTNFSITMATDTRNLDVVVVTALGIKKEARKIGYSATVVNPEELTVNRTTNAFNALEGKIAGVNVSSLGTGPAGTSKIRIRGQSSISGQNNPLIVINGVPVNNTNFGTNPNNTGSDGSIMVRGGGGGTGNTSDGGDGLLSINPDDIESMTVLKGAPASALYGSRAKDGVIMITTKTRGKDKGIGVAYNMNYTNETPLDFTDYQYVYGQGEAGIRPTTASPTSGQWSFGEKIQPGMTQVLFDNVTVPYVAQHNILRKFYRNGQNLSNTISINAGGEKGGMHLSLGNLDSKGITPNNNFHRKTVNLGFAYDLSHKFTVSGNIAYSNEIIKNPPVIANQDNSIPTSLYNMANTMPMDLLDAKKYNAQGNEFIYSRFMNRTNPYWALAEQFQNISRDRLFGNVTLKYDLFKWLSVQGRVGEDYWSRDQDYNNYPTGQASRPAAPAGFVNGLYTQDQRRFRETNIDFLVTATKTFNDFEATLNGGGNQMRRRNDLNSVQVTDFVVRGLYTVQNGRAKDPIYGVDKVGINSLYSSLDLGYKRTFYLNASVRNDWFSTLSKENRSILYPSVALGYVFTEHLKTIPWLNFGKLRAAYAEVGSDADVGAYADQLFYNINSNLFPTPAGAPQPLGGPSGTTVPNANLRPMRVTEIEAGLELKMFNNRVNLDMAVYRKLTTDQIVNAQISDASGFVDTRINSGKNRNIGVEMLLTLVPIRNRNFEWAFTANGAYNKTKVLSLLTSTPGDRITVGTHVFNGELRQVVGEEMGQIAGFGYARDAKGQRIFLSNGLPLRTPDLVNFGSALPRWVGGFTNEFSYKGLSLSFLIDFKLGGKMLSGTNFNAIRHGLHQMTLQGREGGYKGVGVNQSGGENTAIAPVQTYWEHLRSQALIEPVVYNSGYWKLRQITLSYTLTKFIPAKWPIKGVVLSAVASNVLIIKKWVDNIDPESFGYSSDNLVGMESTGVPTTRAIGFNLNVKF